MTSSLPIMVWDADGVLFKTFNGSGDFIWTQNIEDDLGLTDEDVAELFRTPEWHKVLLGTLDAKPVITDHFRKNDIGIPVDQFIDYWLEKDAIINEPLVPLLGRYRSVIATNQSRLRTHKIEKLFGNHVEKVFIPAHAGAQKPSTTFFAHIEQDMGHPPSDFVLIDDTKKNVDSACARGWQGHHFTSNDNLIVFLNNLSLSTSS